MADPADVNELTGLIIERFSIVGDPAIKKKKYLIKTRAKEETADNSVSDNTGKEDEMAKTKEEIAKEEQEKKDAEKQSTKYIVPDDVFSLIAEHLQAVESLLNLKETQKQKEKDEKAKELAVAKTAEELAKEKAAVVDPPKETGTEEQEKEIKALTEKIEALEKEAGEEAAKTIEELKARVDELEGQKKKLEKMRGETQALEAPAEPEEEKPVFGGVFFGPSEE